MSVLPEDNLARRLGFERSAQGDVAFGGQQLRSVKPVRLGAGFTGPHGGRTRAGETREAHLARRGFTPSEISRGREDLVQAARRRQSREDRIFREASGVGEFTAKTDPTGIRQARQDLVAQGSPAGLLGSQRLEREIFDIDTRIKELQPGVQEAFRGAEATVAGVRLPPTPIDREQVQTMSDALRSVGFDEMTAAAIAIEVVNKPAAAREELRTAAAPRIDPAAASEGDRIKFEFLNRRAELAAAAAVEPEFTPETPTGKTAMADIQGLDPGDRKLLSPRLKALDRAAESGDPNAVKSAQASFEKERSRLIARSEKRVTERTKAVTDLRTRRVKILDDLFTGFGADLTRARTEADTFRKQVGEQEEVKDPKTGQVTGFTATTTGAAAPGNVAAAEKRATEFAQKQEAVNLIRQAVSTGETVLTDELARALAVITNSDKAKMQSLAKRVGLAPASVPPPI